MGYKEDNIKLVNIDIDEFKELLYSYYLEIFPKEERKPLGLIESTYNKGYSRIIKIMSNNNITGFMILNRVKKNSYEILDYLAILPQYRNKGIGTSALNLLIEQERESNGIFVETEKVGLGKDKEEKELRSKRKKFYEELGFKKLKFDLVLFGVVYRPYIYSNIDIDEDFIIEEIWNIYEVICGKERINKNCKIIKDLRFEELNADNIKIASKTQYEIFPTSSAYSVYKSKILGTRDSFYVSYIAYLEDKPVGVIGLYEIPEYPDTVWLSWFGLTKEHRKMGLGRQMLDFIIEIAKKNDKKFLRLYTFEIWNNEAQKFYKNNMDIEEYYFNEEEQKDIFEGKPKIFGKSLGNEKISLWNNKFINISQDENSHEKSVIMMKEDGII